MPSHLRHSPWHLKGIQTHPALQLLVIKSEGVWQGFLSLAFLYSIKTSVLDRALVASNSILLEQSVCDRNNLILLLSSTHRVNEAFLPFILRVGANELPHNGVMSWKVVVKITSCCSVFNSLSVTSQLNWLKFKR